MRLPQLTILPLALLAGLLPGAAAQDDLDAAPLPRWREGGTPAPRPDQPLVPYALDLTAVGGQEMPPTSGLLRSPPEYDPTEAVLFRYSSGAWSQVVVDCVAALTGDPATDEEAYVVVSNASQQASAESQFAAAGADLSRVQFFVHPTDSIWLRDYGPHFVWLDGTLTIADSHYYPSRPRDNFVPTLVGEDSLVVPVAPMGLYYSGGNFQPGPARSGFVTSLIASDNPGFGTAYLEELYSTYQGIDTLHVMPQLPGSVDGTGHIDMWMYLVDEDSVIISRFETGSNPTAIAITDNAVPYMEALGFTVHRTPAWNSGSTHYTYTNAFRVNDRIFVPTYASGNPALQPVDQAALAQWQAAAGPNVEIVPIDCYGIIPAAGAIHCIVMQVPRYVDPLPAAHLLSPDGGELLVPGSTHELRWGATDDQAVTSIQLAYSDDGGATFPHLIAAGEPDDGSFTWTVPADADPDTVVQVTAFDAAANATSDAGAAPSRIATASRTTYDFGTGAGVDRWAWGSQTSSWGASVAGNRYPVGTEVTAFDALAYARLAASDATGADADPDRYASPQPTFGSESVHVFEFTLAEDVADLVDIELLWEGYADDCTQVELYVWDLAAGDWCDAAGGVGENRYMQNYAGNRDVVLRAHVRQDFADFVDADGTLTFLVYAERQGDRTFHDYVAVTTTHDMCQEDLGHGGPGAVGLGLCGGDPGKPGGLATLTVAGAAPSAPLLVFLGFVATPTPVEGGVLVPVPWAAIVGAYGTDVSGGFQLAVPSMGPTPTTVYVQAVVPDGGTYEFSNALETVIGL